MTKRMMRLKAAMELKMKAKMSKGKRMKTRRTRVKISMKLSGRTSERTSSSESLRMQATGTSSLSFSGKYIFKQEKLLMMKDLARYLTSGFAPALEPFAV